MPTKTFLKIHVEIAYYSFIFYSIGIEITNTFLHFRSSPKTIPDSRPKRHKNHTFRGGTFLSGSHEGGLPLPPGAGGNLEMANSQSFAHETSTNFVLTESLFKAFNSSSNESFSFINSSIPKRKKESFFSGISLYSGTSLYRYPLNMDTHI